MGLDLVVCRRHRCLETLSELVIFEKKNNRFLKGNPIILHSNEVHLLVAILPYLSVAAWFPSRSFFFVYRNEHPNFSVSERFEALMVVSFSEGSDEMIIGMG